MWQCGSTQFQQTENCRIFNVRFSSDTTHSTPPKHRAAEQASKQDARNTVHNFMVQSDKNPFKES